MLTRRGGDSLTRALVSGDYAGMLSDLRALLDDRTPAALSLRADPAPGAYRAALTAIVRATPATTALLSPPALGEHPGSAANRLAGGLR